MFVSSGLRDWAGMFRFCYRGHCDWLEWVPAPPPFLKVFNSPAQKKNKQTKQNLAVETRWLYIYNALECHDLERFLFMVVCEILYVFVSVCVCERAHSDNINTKEETTKGLTAVNKQLNS